MSISIYNSLTRKKELFEPLNPPRVNIYSCGVTVYDDCHIGHARSLYIFDVIRSYLKYRGFQVNFVRNITDIDDKIINKAREEKVDFSEITSRYIDSYYRDIEAMGIEKADFEPKATENIPEMIEHIQGLINKGVAYVVEGEVYFGVRSFKVYGKLSGTSVDQMLEAVRVEKDPKKKDPLDFALWKKSAEDEPAWDSPWGKGRPGWHIECSVMSQKFLKTPTLDIHAGGRDLIFPHHENEIAQAEALTGKPFAKYWIHHGLLTINGQKMAKSLGNFVTIQDALKRYPAEVLKLFYLASHYASPVDFTEQKMDEAKKALERIQILSEKIARLPVTGSHPASGEEAINDLKSKFIEVMDDDFNTPEAMALIFELVNLANKSIDDHGFVLNVKSALKELLGILGIQFETEEKIIDKEIWTKIEEREDARRHKNYSLADKIRKELENKGIILEDTKDGVTWRRL